MHALQQTSAAPQTGRDVRLACRDNRLTGPTPGLALSFVQANLVIVPREFAPDFRRFCQLNPQACPLLEETEPGEFEAKQLAPGSDLRTDLPGYRVWRHGECVAEPPDIRDLWQSDFVAFLIGCSFTFENALLEASLPVRHLEQGVNVPMYRTNRECQAAGPFAGPLVVSMRPMTLEQAKRAREVCRRFPRAHGEPVHVGEPEALGIVDLLRPDYGDAVTIGGDEVPVFWACGVTPQAALVNARLPLAITHRPGHMFLTDVRDAAMEGE